MKKIILVRHAKSSWKQNLSDKDRPLKTRGITDAQNVALKYLSKSELPVAIYSSPAKRAMDTCAIFLKQAHEFNFKAEIVDDLYDFNGSAVIEFVKNLSDELTQVILFGHNNAFTFIANTYGSEYLENLPTSGLVELEFNIDNWNSLKQGKTLNLIIPKDLRHG